MGIKKKKEKERKGKKDRQREKSAKRNRPEDSKKKKRTLSDFALLFSGETAREFDPILARKNPIEFLPTGALDLRLKINHYTKSFGLSGEGSGDGLDTPYGRARLMSKHLTTMMMMMYRAGF
nr:hypothetical protein BaRGS_030663 [Batillaria attramentaria]